MNDLVKKTSNELIDPQAQLLVGFLKEMGLPADNIIADQSQRLIIGDNIHALLDSIPADLKKDARYLSKFVVGASIGLFDYSLNAVWNEVVLNLRRKAVMYGLDIFFDAAVGGGKAREFYSTEDDLASLKDSVLLDTSRKLELISDTTYKKLKHILDMRNDIGISHPNNYTINAFELLGYLQNCVQDVLQDNPTEAALQVQAFISNLKTRTDPLDNATKKGFENRITELPTHLCGSLLRTLFGIYVAPDTNPAARKNISLVVPGLWRACLDDAKYKLGIVLEGYNVNLYQDKYALGQQFFDVVEGNSFRSSNERVIIVDELITDLQNTHNGWDNFHHEPPIAGQLYSYVPDQKSIFDNLAMRLFKVILMCRIGNGVAYQGGVSPGGKKYYDAILSIAGDKFAPHVMASLAQFEIKNRLHNQQCRGHAKAALSLVRKNVINARLIECLDYLISNIEKDRTIVDSVAFKKLSTGYITWPG